MENSTTVTFTISAALRRLAGLRNEFSEAQVRASGSVSYLQGPNKPAYEFGPMDLERGRLAREIAELKAAIAIANTRGEVDHDGRRIPIIEAIHLLEEMRGEIAWLKGLQIREGVQESVASELDPTGTHYVQKRVEIPWIVGITVKERDTRVRELQRRFEELNGAVEAANHRTKVRVRSPVTK